MEWLHEVVAAKWREQSKQYAQDINEFVRIGVETDWTAQQEEPQDERYRLAPEVMHMIEAANAAGEIEQLHTLLPPASSPLLALFSEEAASTTLQPVFPLGFAGTRVLLQTGIGASISRICLATEDEIILVKDVRRAGFSPDGAYVALADEKGISIIMHPDLELKGIEVAYYEWQSIQSTIADFLPNIQSLATAESAVYSLLQLIPFDQGKSLLLVSEYGVYVLSKGNITILSPSPEEITEYGADYDSTWSSMVHGAVSIDEQWIAYGNQGSEHGLLHMPTQQRHTFAPQSSYPHYSLFNVESTAVWYNACHFYNGATARVNLAAVQRGEIGAYDELQLVDEEMRVYAGVALEQGNILGDAYGYLRLIDHQGVEIWRHYLSGTIAGMTISPDERWLIVGTYSGMAHWLDLHHGSMHEYNIGTAPILETYRWILWNDRVPLRW
ncbi:hypothetical protein ACE3MZ_10170 [Paenibacillus sp. WLX1005]|uniref:hypothetical protein n=1 Tax=Paenibacillus sp. WLX1005 TaxID=3243766 RepID=UPI0039840FE4